MYRVAKSGIMGTLFIGGVSFAEVLTVSNRCSDIYCFGWEVGMGGAILT